MKKSGNKIINIIFNAKFIASLGLVIIVAISFPLAKNISQRRGADEEIANLQREIGDIENKNSDLKKIIEYMGSDQYVEEQARLNFGLKKNGEEAVVIDSSVEAEKGGNAVVSENIFSVPGLRNAETEREATNPEKWWKYFFEKL